MRARTLLSIDELSAQEPAYLYGCGTGGRTLASLLETHPIGGLAGAAVIIASIYKGEILKELAGYELGRLYDGIPLVKLWQKERVIVRLSDS
jgi:hypothetical protein